MKKELVDNAITNIDDKYITEALWYKKNNIIEFTRDFSVKRIVKAASIVITCLCIGYIMMNSLDDVEEITFFTKEKIIANVREKNTKLSETVFFTEHTMSVGNSDYVYDEVLINDDELVETIDNGTVIGDDTVNWIKKREEVVNSRYKNTYYYYYYYEKAAEDAGFDMWFENLPGEVETISYCVSSSENTTTKSINITSDINSNSYFFISQNRFYGAIADDMAYSVLIYNSRNTREYINKKGAKFKLVDGDTNKNDDISTENKTRTYTMVRYDDYYGYIFFSNMLDEDIFEILDQVTFIQ